MKKLDLASISSDEKFHERNQLLAKLIQASAHIFASADQFSENEEQAKNNQIVVLSGTKCQNQQEIAGLVQVAKYAAPEAYLIVVVEKKVSSETAIFIKKSGANAVLLEDEFYFTSKLEFIVAQRTHGLWIPIKASELIPGHPVEMTLYHFMPLNHKFLPFLQKGQMLDEAKHKKMQSVGEFYIRREDIDAFQTYLNNHKDLSANGLKSRCRAQFINMAVSYKDLVRLISDQSEAASFKEGKEFYDRTSKLAQDLIGNLSATGEAWDVVNNSAVDDLSAVDRAPAIAAYAGLISLLTGIGKPEEIMIAALIADIGLLELAPQALEKLKLQGITALEGEDLENYKKHPQVSLNKCLSRKLPIPDKVKTIILGTHERADGKGFPHNWPGDKIILESMLVQYGELMDRMSIVEYGKERLPPNKLREILLENTQKEPNQQFTQEFINKIRSVEW